ncbi:MAG: deoxyribodipyrimidine photo-lyase [Flavobacteriia bacterium]|nr:deoxyribodipyrimidine photo-lyase [Flavobacteriia bacterium]
MSEIAIFWHRRDLRTDDNVGLFQALSSDLPVLPLFIFDSIILDKLEDEDDARVEFIHSELSKVKKAYEKAGGSLIVRHGKPIEVWKSICEEFNVKAVYTNRDYEPYAQGRDKEIYSFLSEKDIPFKGYKDHVIFEKSEVVKDDGDPYLVFSPYARKWLAAVTDNTFKSVDSSSKLDSLYQTDPLPMPSLEDLGFKSSEIDAPSKEVPKEIIDTYDKTRNFPAQNGTTKLSVHLRFGTISIRSLAREGQARNKTYLNELIWRDFYQMILFHHPKSPDEAIKPAYDHIEWETNEEHFKAWCEGRTGYPIVDAGMRELNETGYMHNRVRMIVASFLTKHLLLDWRWGERYFARKLLDYELASNVGGWQWASGSGCDAAPYFRIFNPTSQLEKFDKDLKYVKQWVPEYGTENYPKPIVDHKEARERALSRYKEGLAKT